MNDQPKSYAEWKAEIRGTSISEYPAAPTVSIVEMTIPPMPGRLIAPYTVEDFIHYVQVWDNHRGLRFQHENCEHWTQSPLRPGHLMLVPRTYHFIGAADTTMQVFSVGLQREHLNPLLNDYFTGDPEALRLELKIGFDHAHLHCLMRELRQAKQQSDALAMDCLGQSIGLLLFQHYSPARATRTPGQYRLTPWQQYQLNDYIRTHLDQKISLEQLANVLGISRAHLTRTVKQSTGLAPHQYLLRKRTEQAQHFLRQGRHTIAEVASLTGFTDQSHLNRTFRQTYGITPSQLLPHAS
jgi:AraC family transcriptional regulator